MADVGIGNGIKSGAALWDDVLAKSASSPRDAALLAGLAFRGGDANAVTLSLRDGEAGTGFLRGNIDLIRTTVARLLGRPLEVRLEVEGSAAPKTPVAPRGLIPAEVRDHSIVKLAAELFDAAVVDITPLRRGEAMDVSAAGSAAAGAGSPEASGFNMSAESGAEIGERIGDESDV